MILIVTSLRRFNLSSHLLDEYQKNMDSPNPDKRLPNYMVMSLPENHTRGTAPGAYTPTAMVASNDYAVGLIVDRVTHSK